MRDNEEKSLDDFIKRILNETGLEKPTKDFTTSVLSEIELIARKNTMKYTPIISKSMWVCIVFLTIVLFTFIIFSNPTIETSGWLSILKLNELTAFNTSLKMPELFISNTYVYACVGLAFFVGIQAFVLKQHFDKRYSMS